MPQIRVRVELFKGQELIELTRLAALPNELNAFFQSVGEDAGLLPDDNEWMATKFHDGSLQFTGITERTVPSQTARTYQRIAAGILSGDSDNAHRAGATDRTLLRYVRLANSVRGGESVRIGFLQNRNTRQPKRWFPVDSVTARRIADSINPVAEYEGSIFGLIHSLYKESEQPHFRLRDLARDELVSCYYTAEEYPIVVKALIQRDSRIYVSGQVRANRIDKTVESIRVREIRVAEEFSDSDFEKFFGCAPEMIGALTTEQYIDKVREE